ncbi:hypothetical protein CWC08_19055, partial [Pseudoalteromonas ruthenica]|uniref:fumarate hydratase C-terminal domain-containing protein n=1 Tax=Pseudoalteromonas ruthenica TaxID=151081 RepID=UPI001109A32C
GIEAIYEFELEDMPVTVAVDSEGANAHSQGPAIWKAKIEELDGAWKLCIGAVKKGAGAQLFYGVIQ